MLNVQTFTFNPVQENTYILYNEERLCCIIDPGCYFASEEIELRNFIELHQLTPKYLLNTHCHLDHIFGNRFVHKAFGLSLHLHKLEKQVLDFGPASGQMWQLPFDNYDGELKFIEEGEVIKLGNDELDILFTPGHSPGHVCFYEKAAKFLTNPEVNDIARGNTFRPVEGNGQKSENQFTWSDGKGTTWLAIFNYTDKDTLVDIPFKRIGIDPGKAYSIKDLWSNLQINSHTNLEVHAKDVRFLKIFMKN